MYTCVPYTKFIRLFKNTLIISSNARVLVINIVSELKASVFCAEIRIGKLTVDFVNL